MDIAQGGTFSRRHQLTAKIIGGSDHTGGDIFLVVLVDVKDSLAAFRLLDTVAVAIINKGGPAGDRQRPVLDIPGNGLRAAGGELDLWRC